MTVSHNNNIIMNISIVSNSYTYTCKATSLVCLPLENYCFKCLVYTSVLRCYCSVLTAEQSGRDTAIMTPHCVCDGSTMWYRMPHQQAIYRSVPGKRPWVLKHNSRFSPAWALTRDQNPIRLYRSCYSGPLKCGTWALARDTTVMATTTCEVNTASRGDAVINKQCLHNWDGHSLQVCSVYSLNLVSW